MAIFKSYVTNYQKVYLPTNTWLGIFTNTWLGHFVTKMLVKMMLLTAHWRIQNPLLVIPLRAGRLRAGLYRNPIICTAKRMVETLWMLWNTGMFTTYQLVQDFATIHSMNVPNALVMCKQFKNHQIMTNVHLLNCLRTDFFLVTSPTPCFNPANTGVKNPLIKASRKVVPVMFAKNIPSN